MNSNYTVLFLTNNDNTLPLLSWIRERCNVVEMREKITLEFVEALNPDLAISFNYKYIVKKDVIAFLGKRIINLHISYLPWNKGSNPNFWSFFDDTPKGVTIHQLEAGLDTGDIIFQKEVRMNPKEESFTSSYDKLLNAIMDLFRENWESLQKLDWKAKPQQEEGTGHTMKDMDEVLEGCSLRWSDNIAEYLERYDRLHSHKLYIRADMNEVIATGHMMRCLSIADAAREQGKEAIFITADEKPLELLEKRGYKAIVLNTLWQDMEAELEVLLPLIRRKRIRKLLIDSYQVTEAYLKRVEEGSEVFYLDDLDAFRYPVSNVICYANYYASLSYGNRTKEDGYYLGTSYMPLRRVYQNCPKKQIREEISRILILSGGSDNYNMIERLSALFCEQKELWADVICGAFYPDFEGLKKRFEGYPNLHFHRNVDNLEEYMAKADLAISAGGTTLYELCAVGTPAISYSFADNQLGNVKQFEAEGLIGYGGDIRYDSVCDRVRELFEEYRSPRLRQERSLRMQKLVDGLGARRIAALLTEE